MLTWIHFILALVLTILGAISINGCSGALDALKKASVSPPQSLVDARKASVGVVVIGILLLLYSGYCIWTHYQQTGSWFDMKSLRASRGHGGRYYGYSF